MDSIIFDVDGTLWNASEVIARAWTQYIQEEAHMDMEITQEGLMPLLGRLMPDIASQLWPDLSKEEQLRMIDGCCAQEHRLLLEEGAPLYEGLEEMLRELSARYPLFIVSNCQAGYIEVFLEATGFGRYFTGHLCPGDTGLPKGDNIIQISRDYHLKSPVYVGDTMGDYQACQKAKVPFIFASYGFGQVDTPDYRIEKPLDLLAICASEQA